MWTKLKYPVYLLLVVLLCYWPLTFFQSTLLCDDIDVALPTKYFAGECYQNGLLPLWNPFQIWGYPAHADLQYTNWNIEVLTVGILKGYDYNTLQVIFIGYLFLAGLGMFYLSRYLSRHEPTAFFVACVYMLGGLTVAHVQSLVTILGIVWIPYVLLHFLKFLEKPDLRQTLLLCFFAYLLFTLGYQAFAFMLLPVFVTLAAVNVWQSYRNKNAAAIRRLLGWGLVACVVMGLLLSPVLITQLQSKPFVSRLNGMPLNEVMSNPFAPRALVSLVNPELTLINENAFEADITMRNIYMGILPLLLLVLSFFKRRKSALEIVLLVFALLYLLGSFGPALPVREWMFHLLPGFKLFRFPSLLRVVVIICLLCYLSIRFRESLLQLFESRRLKWIILSAGLALVVSAGIYALVNVEAFRFFSVSADNFNNRVKAVSPYEIVCYIALIQLLVLIGFAWLSFRTRLIGHYQRALTGLVLIEFFGVILLYGQHTAFTNSRPETLQANFATLPQGFPFPSPDPVADNRAKFNQLKGVWLNTGCYKKQLMIGDECTSYYFANYDKMINHAAWIKDSLNSYPFIYAAKPKTSETRVGLPVDTSLAFITSSFHVQDAKAEIAYKAYNPNYLLFDCKAGEDLILNLQQSYFTGWTVKIDGRDVQPLWNMGMLMSLPISAGVHSVELRFENKPFVYTLCLSYAVLFVLVLIVLYTGYLNPLQKRIAITAWIGFAVLLLVTFLLHSEKEKPYNRFTIAGKTLDLDLGRKADVKKLMQALEALNPGKVDYKWHAYYNAPELRYVLGDTGSDWTLSGEKQLMPSDQHQQGFTETFDSTDKPYPFADSVSYNGSKAVLMDLSNVYSIAKMLDPSAYAGKHIYGTLRMKAEKGSDPLVICHIRHRDSTEHMLYFPLNKYYVYDGSWQTIPYFIESKDLIRPDDREIRFFLMNDRKSKLWADDWRATARQK